MLKGQAGLGLDVPVLGPGLLDHSLITLSNTTPALTGRDDPRAALVLLILSAAPGRRLCRPGRGLCAASDSA